MPHVIMNIVKLFSLYYILHIILPYKNIVIPIFNINRSSALLTHFCKKKVVVSRILSTILNINSGTMIVLIAS